MPGYSSEMLEISRKASGCGTTFSSASSARVARSQAIVLLMAFGLVLLPAAFGAEQWRAGAASTRITPEKPLWMTGYGFRERPADGTALDLNAKALALEDPQGQRGVLLAVDLCGLTRAITDRVASRLETSHGLPRSAVMVNVSHTHCSPFIEGYLEGLREFPASVREEITTYRLWLEDRLTEVAAKALDALRPVSLAASEDSADFAVNRRNNPADQVPERRAAGTLVGPVDHRVPVLTLRAPDGKLVAVVTSYACHNTTLNFFQWHGDYAGVAQRELETRHPGAIALFASGCGADSNPLPRGDLTFVETYGRALADAVDRAMAKPQKTVSGRFASAWKDLPLAFDHAPTSEELTAAAASTQAIDRLWARRMQARLRKGPLPSSYTYPLQAWQIGEIAWLALGGEVVVDYSLRLRRENAGNLWVLGYSNDVMAYIPSERVLTEGGYEGQTSMKVYDHPSGWKPGLEEQISEAAAALLKTVSGAK